MILKKILPFFSYLFHPIFISVYAALFYFFSITTPYLNLDIVFVFFQIVIITILLPILFFYLLRTLGRINSMQVVDVSQRKIPLLFQSILTILLIRKTITIENFPEFHFFFLGGLVSTISALVLLFFNVKASIHLLAISSLTVFVIGISIHNQCFNSYWIAFLVLMNGFVASSRLEMRAHTSKELIIGFICGIIPQLFLLRYWL